ncbi:3-phosphoshikimate 1-carboxyvinyltransferase [Paraglaciecola sp. 20A4]|uniref:3-phosphoshikimate 1-carboxyvinyltransferase n=1 Tax=Paraglaciecola sp. 20A4 TaxID=2687288 RepID=UPI00140B1423|nr:3-phosphoshikimate 1-carboxyvinyltransferase [Paraglaciecola sp. 20A4]
MAHKNSQIKDEPAMRKLLERMPDPIAESFTNDQLLHLKIALGARQWGKHKVDFRGTVALPFVPSKIYYVLLMGKNHRDLSRTEKAVSAFTVTLFVSLFIFICVLVGLLVIYLLKSALGINLFENFSLGIWSWFKGLW